MAALATAAAAKEGVKILGFALGDKVGGFSKIFQTRTRDNTFLFVLLALFIIAGILIPVIVLKK